MLKLSVPFQELLQNERLIMLLVASPVDKSDGAFSGFLLEDREHFVVMPNLSFVPRPKLFRRSVLGAISFSHRSKDAFSFVRPRGQSLSTRMRKPSSLAGFS